MVAHLPSCSPSISRKNHGVSELRLSLVCVEDAHGWPGMTHFCFRRTKFLKGCDQHFCFDSNCLFRALGDQLEGHSRNHLQHRQETVDYMIKQREDFEPFVEDDIPFEKHGRFPWDTGSSRSNSLGN